MKIAFRKNESAYLWSISLADNSIVCSTERQNLKLNQINKLLLQAGRTVRTFRKKQSLRYFQNIDLFSQNPYKLLL